MISDQLIKDLAREKTFEVISVAEVARKLKISRQALHQRLQKLEIQHGFPRRKRAK